MIGRDEPSQPHVVGARKHLHDLHHGDGGRNLMPIEVSDDDQRGAANDAQ